MQLNSTHWTFKLTPLERSFKVHELLLDVCCMMLSGVLSARYCLYPAHDKRCSSKTKKREAALTRWLCAWAKQWEERLHWLDQQTQLVRASVTSWRQSTYSTKTRDHMCIPAVHDMLFSCHTFTPQPAVEGKLTVQTVTHSHAHNVTHSLLLAWPWPC